jgi:uncharacterized protein
MNDQNLVTTENVSQDAKNLAIIAWLGSIFVGFIAGLLIYLLKKDDAYVQDQAKESLNWSITLFFGFLIGFVLTFVIIGIFINLALILMNLVVCIMGAIAASNGKPFRTPFAIRLIK